ncbi:MAG: two-component system response regulator [Paenibacillaceae bacterium]|jgi:two-component system response regulator YesN|nr:two-component system response regulator [Paenibacillaceae bacterium]
MMWKVVLIEDELFVRNSIKQLVPWEELGFILIDEAGDGNTALDIIVKQRPDLVISDIIMPEMDGVMLLKSVRELGMNTKFIMLTCMSDFEYARAALELGATSYVLKLSMDINKLKDSLRKVSSELNRESEHIRRNLLAKLPDMYDQIWSVISTSTTGICQIKGLTELSNSLEAGGNAPSQVCVVLTGAESIESACNLTITEDIHIYKAEAPGITTLVDWSGKYDSGFQTIQEKYYSRCLIDSVTTLKDLPQVWWRLLADLIPYWYDKQNDASVKTASYSESWQIPWEQERRLILAWELGLIEEMKHSLLAIWTTMASHEIPVLQVKRFAAHLIDQYKRTKNIHRVQSDNFIISDSKRHSELLHVLIDVLTANMKIMNQSAVPSTDHPEVNRIIQFIHENYEANIGLKTTASFVNMDETYLSALFKKKTGYTFIHYLQKIRIEQAMRYLEKTELTVSHIGASVGFSHDHYFIKIFKKITGLTPSEYRKANKE